MDRLPQALEGDPQRLGQEDGRPVRQGPPRHRRAEAPGRRLLLEPRQQVHPLRQGQRRRRELQRLGRRPGRRPPRPARTPRRPQPDRRQGRSAAQIYDVPKTDPDVVFVGLNDRDAAWHDLYKVKISTGERTLLRKNTEKIAGWVFDLAGQLRLAARIADNGDTEVLRVDPEGFTKVYSCSVFEIVRPGPLPQGRQAGLHGDEQGRAGPRRPRPLRPGDRQGGGRRDRPEGARRLRQRRLLRGDRRARRHDLRGREDPDLLPRQGAGRPTTGSSRRSSRTGRSLSARRTADDRLWMVAAYSDVDPGTRYLFDRKTKKLSVEYVSRERIPREHMAAMKPIRYPSSDGLMIPAYLTLPKGVPAKGLPARRLPARRPLGPRLLGLQQLRAVPREPRLRRPRRRTSAAPPATGRSSSTPGTTSGAT